MERKSRKRFIVLIIVAFQLGIPLVGYHYLPEREDSFLADYREHCQVCHGYNLEGAAQGPPLVGVELKHGDSVDDIRRSIRRGYANKGMPGWSRQLNEGQRASLAILIAEKRLDFDMSDLKGGAEIVVPEEQLSSEHHAFRVEVFARDLDSAPFAIEPLPDGSFLLTEKTKGLSIITPTGARGPYIEGTPDVHDDAVKVGDLEIDLGWFLDVALHPDYEENGWVYLHYGDRADSSRSLLPVSMNRLERARIKDGKWTDVQTIWRAGNDAYTSTPEVGAGGRIAFDDTGHVYISIGMKGSSNYDGIQDLDMPYGKTHRVNDDGTIPPDNPFATMVDTTPGWSGADPRQTVWTYGHRSPLGLEFNHLTGELWGAEMGPRGGDEVNLLLAGRNYGWPLTSLGVDYNGTPVEYGEVLGIEFDLADIEQPIVDFSPSPAISNLVFYRGDAFPAWRDDIIIGSLKAATLYRLVIEDNRLVHKETLIRNLARIRDVAVGYDGLLYLLLESSLGSMIVRLVPA